VEAPLRFQPPTLDAALLASRGIGERLASASASFAMFAPPQAANMRAAARHLGRVFVPPGETFSLNAALGPITAARGFRAGRVIAGGRIGSDIGGGLCAVSTLVHRAALLAGLPYLEWHPHTFRLDFYEREGWPPGLDATFYQSNADPRRGLDLKFANPTDAWLLLQVTVAGARLEAELFGPATGYEVVLSPPSFGAPVPPPPPVEQPARWLPPGRRRRTLAPQDGVTVTVTRRVLRGGEPVLEDTFVSRYRPQAEIVAVGVGDG
jgi:vancomycin resistance protein YoaR